MTEPTKPANQMIPLDPPGSRIQRWVPADRLRLTELTADENGTLYGTFTIGPSDAEQRWSQ